MRLFGIKAVVSIAMVLIAFTVWTVIGVSPAKAIGWTCPGWILAQCVPDGGGDGSDYCNAQWQQCQDYCGADNGGDGVCCSQCTEGNAQCWCWQFELE